MATAATTTRISFVANTTGVITARAITVTAATNTKTYDATTSAAATPTITSGAVQTGDTANFSEVARTKNAGTGLTLTPSGTVTDGNSGNNYTYTFVNNTTGIINKRALTVTAATNTKTYDGTTSAAATPTITSGAVQTGDTANFTEAYSSKNAGTGKTLTPSGTVSDGNSGNNYAYTFVNNTSGVISQLAVTVAAVNATKTADGTTTATGTPTITPGLVAGDTTTVLSQAFQNKNAGVGNKVIVPSITISDGNSGANYAVTLQNFTTGTINPLAITVTAAANSKPYDGTTSATATPGISPSLATGDTSGFTETYDTRNAGTGKTLTPAGTVNDGNSGNNYNVTFVNNTTGVITAKAITVTAVATSKGYDGTTTSSGTPNISPGLAPGDTSGFTQAYSTKNAGAGNKTIIPSGTALDGNGGNNYAVTFVNSTTGTITARAITVTAATDSKVYDGGTSSTGTPTITTGSLATGDTANFTQAFANRNVGTGNKTIVPSGTVNDGNGGANYAVTFVNNNTGTITARPLTVTAQSNSKVYDGTTAAAAIPSPVGLQDSDTPNFIETYNDKTVATGKTLTPSGSVSDGNGGNNYSYTFVADTTGVISAKALTVTATAQNKVYDGTATATVTLTDNRFSGDVFTDSDTSATFADKNVGNGKTVTVSGISSSGTDAGNYTWNTTASTTANITAKALLVTATGVNKVYDGSTAATVTLSDNRVSGDVFMDSYASATFASAPVGTGISVSVTGISISGTDAGNYTFNTTASTTADITQKTITASATAANKVYDGTTTATLASSSLTGVVPGDNVVLNVNSATFSDRNVGNGKTVTVSLGSLGGGDHKDYILATTTIFTTANITPAPLTITAVSNTKTYDTTTSAAAIPMVAGVQVGDSVTGLTEVYADAKAGTGKTLSVATFTVNDGNGGNNYTVSTVQNFTGVINQAGLTITADNESKVYGTTFTPDGTSQFTSSGLLTGDSISSVTLMSGAYAATAMVGGSPYPITPSAATGTGLGNYAITYDTGTLTVNQATLTITADNENKTYGMSVTPLGTEFMSSGLLNGDTVTSVTLMSAGYATNATVGSPGPGYTITPSAALGSGLGNYTVAYDPGTLTVNAATLAITANPQTKIYGQNDPTLTYGVSGLQNGDTAGSVLTGSLTPALPARQWTAVLTPSARGR